MQFTAQSQLVGAYYHLALIQQDNYIYTLPVPVQ